MSGRAPKFRRRCPPNARPDGAERVRGLKHATVWFLLGLVLVTAPAAASAVTLPDHRAYELVSRYAPNGKEGELAGITPEFAAAAPDGDVVDWQALGPCCGATSGGPNLYQAVRGPTGWETSSITPTPSPPLSGLQELQEARFWSQDLSQTIFSTPASYTPGDQRPTGSGGNDLYLRGPTGALTWLSQGPSGTGEGPYPTRFDAATPHVGEVIFNSAEPLTANASGLVAPKWGYLYARNLETETTSLIDIDNSGKPISPYGATLGAAGPPNEGLLSFSLNSGGSTTNALSDDGSKIFFETPPAEAEGLPEGATPHLYMRDLVNNTTTALDNPASTGSARYEGASADGSLVFFTSDEGLDGASTATELYEFNTTAEPIGAAPPMAAVPVARGAGINGVTAIANDGSHLFFVASDVLAANSNSAGLAAVPNQPNLYVYDTSSTETQFVTTLAPTDVDTCKPTCASIEPSNLGLISEPGIYRTAYPTPDGSVLVFLSSGDLTGEARTPTTTLTSTAYAEEHILRVASTAGFLPRRTIAIGTGEEEELDTIETIDSPTELTISEYGPAIKFGIVQEHATGSTVTAVNSEVYRYSTSGGSLTCLSCTPPGVLETESAELGEVGGGTYAPPKYPAQMSEDGSRIFFDSPDPLVAGMAEAVTGKLYEPTNVYEWENGRVSLISDSANSGSVFRGTTPTGNDVFFGTRSALTSGAIPGSEHIYDARVDGGFPVEAENSTACAEESCRPSGSGATDFPAPASASGVTGGSVPSLNSATPTFTVGSVTAAQRTTLVRTGQLILTVHATAAGEIAASATAKLRGRQTRVAHVSTTLHRADTVTLTLRLSKAARQQLAQRKALAIRVEVRYVPTGAVDVIQMTLRSIGAHQPAVRQHSHHA